MNSNLTNMTEDERFLNKASPMEKHYRYTLYYKPNDLFWGVGIERESYFETDTPAVMPISFLSNQKRERYSINYYTSYISGILEDIINKSYPVNGTIKLPFLVN